MNKRTNHPPKPFGISPNISVVPEFADLYSNNSIVRSKHQKFLSFLFSCSTSLIYFFAPAQVFAQSITDISILKVPETSRISVKYYFQLLKGDFLEQLYSPLKLAKHLPEVGSFALATVALMKYDRAINAYTMNVRQRSAPLARISPQVTRFGGRYALFTMGAIGATGIVVGDSKLFNSTLLATQAYLTSGIWVASLKFVTGRERPSYLNSQSAQSTGTWHGPFYQFKLRTNGMKPDGAAFSSFPSGHAAAAFSIASTYAEMYKDKPWVVVLSYTSSSAIALSRISESKHWMSDVLVSSALGFLAGKQAVRNFRKLNRLNSFAGKKKGQFEFGLGYSSGAVLPSVTYVFP